GEADFDPAVEPGLKLPCPFVAIAPANMIGSIAQRWRPHFFAHATPLCSWSSAVGKKPSFDVRAARIAPENVGHSVMIDIADAGKLRMARMHADIGAAGPLAVLNLPKLRLAAGRIVPEDIAGSVIGEVGDGCGLPGLAVRTE